MQQGLQMAAMQLQNPPPQLAPVLAWYKEKENQELIGLLGDLCSTEIFIYGGPEWSGFVGRASWTSTMPSRTAR